MTVKKGSMIRETYRDALTAASSQAKTFEIYSSEGVKECERVSAWCLEILIQLFQERIRRVPDEDKVLTEDEEINE